VAPPRTGSRRSTRLLAPIILSALLVSAGGAGARGRRHTDPPGLSPASLAAAQDRVVERLAGLRLPVFCGAGRLPNVALTFDDGPSPYTLSLLRLLRSSGTPATFFLVGDRLADWPDAAPREAPFGALGDHTWSHPRLRRLRYDAAAWEITAGRRAIEAAAARKVVLFRPPYGQMTPRLDRLVARLGMLDVRWSVDSGDARPGATVRSVVGAVEATARPGSIVLFHDIHPWTLVAVRRLLPWLDRHALRPVTVPELLLLDAPTVRQLRGENGPRCAE
jgi:peptidoglycan/xylan/chitin deacetylase (PgdA/CDA1 family)